MNQSALKSAFAWGKVTRAFLGAALLGLASAGSALAAGKVGEMAYEWSNYKDLKGMTRSLKDYRGKTVLLFSLEYGCGGCKGNASRIGQIAMKYQGKGFQAIGVELSRGSYSLLMPLDSNFSLILKSLAKDVDFPIVIGIPDSQIIARNTTTATDGEKWAPYDSYRDVYFVLDYTGKIVGRIDGDRRQSMGEQNFAALDSSIAKAARSIPTTAVFSANDPHGLCLQACKRDGAFQIQMSSAGSAGQSDIVMSIMDMEGRLIRNLKITDGDYTRSGKSAVWDGRDEQGKLVSWGSYFLNAHSRSSSSSLLLSLLP